MTQQQALAIAKKEFGESAVVEIDPKVFYPRMRYVKPSVDASTLTSGQGKTWDAALNQAIYKRNVRLGVWS